MSTAQQPVEVTVNGSAVVFDRAPDVPMLLAHLGLPDRGVAVAVDGMVRPQARWTEPIGAYSRVDVLTAVQGG